MAEEIRGFGGLYYDEQGRPNVYLTDVREGETLRKAFGEVIVKEGDYDFKQLAGWRAELRSALNVPGVVMLDVDERSNRVRIAMNRQARDRENNREHLEYFLALQGIPRKAVEVVEMEPIRYAATLRDRVRPVPGGMQIAFGGYVCTMGFNAYRNGVFGFVTNSHCTNVQGGVESTRYYQNSTSGGAIATEIADPGYFTGGSCPAGRRCRYSDSSFARYDSTSLGEYRRIARTTSRGTSSGSLTINSTSPRFTITSRVPYPTTGQVLNKMGRTTGWTYGTVSSTCVDINVSGTNITQLCQDLVNAGVNSGDSGSPVFGWSGSGSNVTIYGVLWGGSTSQFVFSALDNIESELGALTIY